MTDNELIDRLCDINALQSEIIKEQEQIIKRHEITVQAESKLAKQKRIAETENKAISAALHTII